MFKSTVYNGVIFKSKIYKLSYKVKTPGKTWCFYRRDKSISRVLYLTIIYLGPLLLMGSSDTPRDETGNLMCLSIDLAPDGVYIAAKSPLRW